MTRLVLEAECHLSSGFLSMDLLLGPIHHIFPIRHEPPKCRKQTVFWRLRSHAIGSSTSSSWRVCSGSTCRIASKRTITMFFMRSLNWWYMKWCIWINGWVMGHSFRLGPFSRIRWMPGWIPFASLSSALPPSLWRRSSGFRWGTVDITGKITVGRSVHPRAIARHSLGKFLQELTTATAKTLILISHPVPGIVRWKTLQTSPLLRGLMNKPLLCIGLILTKGGLDLIGWCQGQTRFWDVVVI